MSDVSDSNSPVNRRQVVVVTAISIGYLLLSYFVVGFKIDQVFLVLVFNTLFYLSKITRKFIIGFSIFVVYWIIFDYMKAFPNYNFARVHIQDLYNLEKRLFSIKTNHTLLTPNEYWRLNGQPILDLFSGIFYLCWVPVPLAFATFLFFTRKKQFLLFSLTFVLVNLIGFVIYYIYPAAPPWYVQNYGFVFHPFTRSNPAGLSKFDALVHLNVFKSIYAKGSNVFAAMPSLHSAYPVVVLYYGLKSRLGLVNIFFALVMFGIWFSAVYASHHYVLDVLAGITCAIMGIALFNLLYKRSDAARNVLNKFERHIN